MLWLTCFTIQNALRACNLARLRSVRQSSEAPSKPRPKNLRKTCFSPKQKNANSFAADTLPNPAASNIFPDCSMYAQAYLWNACSNRAKFAAALR